MPCARRGASRRDKKSVQFFLTDSTRVQKSQLFFLYTSYRRETTKKENATFLEIIIPLLISLRVPGYLRLILVLYHYAPRNACWPLRWLVGWWTDLTDCQYCRHAVHTSLLRKKLIIHEVPEKIPPLHL